MSVGRSLGSGRNRPLPRLSSPCIAPLGKHIHDRYDRRSRSPLRGKSLWDEHLVRYVNWSANQGVVGSNPPRRAKYHGLKPPPRWLFPLMQGNLQETPGIPMTFCDLPAASKVLIVQVRISLNHFKRRPSTQGLQHIQSCTVVRMPTRPGVPQIVPAKSRPHSSIAITSVPDGRQLLSTAIAACDTAEPFRRPDAYRPRSYSTATAFRRRTRCRRVRHPDTISYT